MGQYVWIVVGRDLDEFAGHGFPANGNTRFLCAKVFLDHSLLATVHHDGVKSSGVPGDAGSTRPQAFSFAVYKLHIFR